ncbi:MAG: glycosyltransferase [Bacteriovoracia bacterium]
MGKKLFKRVFSFAVFSYFLCFIFLSIGWARPYRVLFLTMDTGNGHISVAKALLERFKTAVQNGEISGLGQFEEDYLELTTLMSPLGILATKKNYEIVSQKTPALFEKIFQISMQRTVSYLIEQSQRILIRGEMEDGFLKLDPDIIISTHPTTSFVVSQLRERGVLRPEVTMLSFVTDWVAHPFFDYEDFLAVAHEDIRKQMSSKFLRPLNTTFTLPGLPAQSGFLEEFDKATAREKLQLKKDVPVFLAMGGGGGWKLERLAEFLPYWAPTKEVQLVVICGKNEELRSYLLKLKARLPKKIHLRVLAFSDQVDDYMKAADILISKPGGATTAESIALKLPLFIPDLIRGQETYNLEFLEKINGAVYLHSMSLLNDVDLVLEKAKKVSINLSREFGDSKDVGDAFIRLFEKIVGHFEYRKKQHECGRLITYRGPLASF